MTQQTIYELGFIVPQTELGQLYSDHKGALSLVKYNTKWIVKSHYSLKSGTMFQAFLRTDRARATELEEALREEGYQIVRSKKL